MVKTGQEAKAHVKALQRHKLQKNKPIKSSVPPPKLQVSIKEIAAPSPHSPTLNHRNSLSLSFRFIQTV